LQGDTIKDLILDCEIVGVERGKAASESTTTTAGIAGGGGSGGGGGGGGGGGSSGGGDEKVKLLAFQTLSSRGR